MAWILRDGFWVNDETGSRLENKGDNRKGGDGYKHNNLIGGEGTKAQFNEIVKQYLSTGVIPDDNELNRIVREIDGDGSRALNKFRVNNIKSDLESFIRNNGLDQNSEQERLRKGIGLTPENQYSIAEGNQQLNYYEQYLENAANEREGQELGLLNEQSRINRQNAEILAQQNIIQQAQFKDQLLEQIKTDRMSKLRSGMSAYQIANEEMQFMVGNMQNNNQQISQVNQQNLATQQQQSLNPYQAYINSRDAITGGQGMGTVATGLAAVDAGDLNSQIQLYLRNNRGSTYEQARQAVQGIQPTK